MIPIAYYPYDAYAAVWDGSSWSKRTRLSGPFDHERYWHLWSGRKIATISPDNNLVGTFEHGEDGYHYLCCTRLSDGTRLSTFPTPENCEFSPDSQWLTYMRFEPAEPSDPRYSPTWYQTRCVATVDGSVTLDLESPSRNVYRDTPHRRDDRLVGWGL